MAKTISKEHAQGAVALLIFCALALPCGLWLMFGNFGLGTGLLIDAFAAGVLVFASFFGD